MQPFQFNTTAGLRFGNGFAVSSCEEISKKLGSRILFITDKGLMSLGLTKPIIDELSKKNSIEIFVFGKKKKTYHSIFVKNQYLKNFLAGKKLPLKN